MKIGDKTIPENRLPSLIEAVKVLYGKFGTKEIDDETASRLLGHTTSRSGAYIQKRADLRAFGLIEPRGPIKVTEIGRKVSYPNNTKEEQEGLIQAIMNIELWKLIYEKYTKKGLTLPSDFWTDIREWTGLPPEEAKKAAEIVRKAYLEDIKYIKPEIGLEKEAEVMETEKSGISTAIPEGAVGRIILKDAGYIDVRDRHTYELAQAYLKIFAEKLGIAKEGKNEKKQEG
jgi:hypothetical protein